MAEVRHYATHSYEWIVEGDIKACFDEISHSALLARVRRRVGDKRVLMLVKAFLKAGVLGEDRSLRETSTGTPQGSILSPLLSNVALTVLDDYVDRAPGGPATGQAERAKRRRHGRPNVRLTRYADDWCLLVHGTREDAERWRDEIAQVLSTIGLRLSPEKTLITHMDKGLDFLGWRIQRHRKRGSGKSYVYTYPAKKALLAITAKVKTICQMSTNRPLAALIHQLNPVLRGWCSHFRPGVSSASFSYLRKVVWQLVMHWLRRKHAGRGHLAAWKDIRRRYCDGGWWPHAAEVKLYNPAAVRTMRYRYRGTRITSSWPDAA